MSKEFVFWFYVMPKRNFVFLWNMPKDLVRVVITQNGIKSDGAMHINNNDVLDISLSDVTEIKVNLPRGGPTSINIETKKLKFQSLLPVNPFDPRLLSHRNYDETQSFIHIVKALMANAAPEFDENPYIRQSKRKDKPDYVNSKLDFQWDKDISPWKYYFEYVPVSQDKMSLLVAKVWKFVFWGLLSFLVFSAFLGIYVQVTGANRFYFSKAIEIMAYTAFFGFLGFGLLVNIYAQIKK